ncbi:NHLP family bacteriocin export ABC transporter peptidase/permease/ATPase subunit [Anaerolineales bacterium]
MAFTAPSPRPKLQFKPTRRYKVPTILQMEAVECGAACLSMIFAYYDLFVPLEKLRVECGVTRDGVKAKNIIRVARSFGMEAKGFRKELSDVTELPLPIIVFWNFNHFVVVEGFSKNKVYLNDPALGARVVSAAEFDESFTGVVLTFIPNEDFKPEGKKPGMVRSLIPRLRSSKQDLLYIGLLSLGLVIPGIAIPAFTRAFIDSILIEGQNWLELLILLMIVVAILQMILVGLQQFYLLRLEMKLAITTSSQFLWHLLHLPIDFFSQRYSGEISSRVQINDRIARVLSKELATAVLSLMLVIFYLILLVSYSPVLTAIGLSIALINVLILRFIANRRVTANQRLLQERGNLVGTVTNGLYTIETIKATGAELDLFSRFAGYQAKVLNVEQQFKLISQVLLVVPPLLSALNTAIILYVGIRWQVLSGEMTIGALVAFQILMANFITPFNRLLDLVGLLQETEGDMSRLDDVLNYDALNFENKSIESDLEGGRSPKLTGHIDLVSVTFGYNRFDPPLIEDFSLKIPSGSRIAIVGGSGSGKSTLSKLIAGLYQPWNGVIQFDKRLRSEIPRSILTNSIAFVDQDIVLYAGTVQDNITLWDQTIPESDIIAAAKDALIHNDILERSHGYNHFIEEGGRNFSGGQRQRIEIARALVNNPSILILDEATSSLDPVVEKEIDENLRRRGCTCVMIAHRLSTIRDCDEIIVLDRGRVVQRGTHDQLIEQKQGYYSELIKSEAVRDEQAKAYLEYLF